MDMQCTWRFHITGDPVRILEAVDAVWKHLRILNTEQVHPIAVTRDQEQSTVDVVVGIDITAVEAGSSYATTAVETAIRASGVTVVRWAEAASLMGYGVLYTDGELKVD